MGPLALGGHSVDATTPDGWVGVWVWVGVGGYGWVWGAVGGCGWVWVGVDGCGCVWVGVGGCGVELKKLSKYYTTLN